MFSVIHAHQLKALNFQLPTYVSEDQNDAERPVCVCLPVCLSVEKSFSFQFKHDTSTNFLFCVYSQKARVFDIMVLKYMYIKLDNTMWNTLLKQFTFPIWLFTCALKNKRKWITPFFHIFLFRFSQRWLWLVGVLGHTPYRRREMFRVSEHTTAFTVRADEPSTIKVEADISFHRQCISTTLHDVTSKNTTLVNPHNFPYFCCFSFWHLHTTRKVRW